MLRGFSAEIRRVVLFTVLCAGFGLLNGYLSWTLILGGAIYMAWMLWQIHQLDVWLQAPQDQEPPDAVGIWGDIFDNITRLRKRQQREKMRLQSVIKRGQETTAALKDGIILLDSRGNLDWFNEAASELLGLQSEDQGHPLINYVRHPQFILYFEKGAFTEPLDLPSPHGGRRLQFQFTRFGQDEHLLMVRDITRIYKLEQMRKDFVANVSHELRTPLTVIRGYIETLQMSPDLPAPWEKALAQMEQQGQRMTTLINDLLALSKLETDSLEQQHTVVLLQPLLSNICNDAKALSGDNQHQITLNCADTVSVTGSEKELRSAFSNLLFNAVKYSAANTPINIDVSQTATAVRIAVVDKGYGIDPAHIPRLTERFYRVDNSRTSATGGTGLGLAIVKHILLRHKARLEIDSELGKGSRFTCVFPLARKSATNEKTNSGEKINSTEQKSA